MLWYNGRPLPSSLAVETELGALTTSWMSNASFGSKFSEPCGVDASTSSLRRLHAALNSALTAATKIPSRPAQHSLPRGCTTCPCAGQEQGIARWLRTAGQGVCSAAQAGTKLTGAAGTGVGE